MDKTAVTTAIYALLAALGEDTVPAAAAEAAPPAPKKAGKASDKQAADKPAADRPAANLAITGEERKALRAEFRAKHGPEWFTDPAVKAEYDRLAWAKRTGAPAPAAEPKAPAMAAEGGIDAMGLRALQALRKQMGMKGRLGESAEEVREQIRGARAAAEPRTKPAAKPAAKGKGRREVC
jgi:hypothetical protein